MQIDRTDSSSPVRALRTSDKPAGRLGEDQQRGGRSDEIQLSGLAQQLTGSDSSRVNQLEAAVAAGTYNVPPGEIARSLISNAFA
jgi:anti-sigma28 factor (negative regulator of flagellin synthesis)